MKELCDCERRPQNNSDVYCQTDTFGNKELEKTNIACQTEDVDRRPIQKIIQIASQTEKEIVKETTIRTNNLSIENKNSAEKVNAEMIGRQNQMSQVQVPFQSKFFLKFCSIYTIIL